MHKSNKQNGRHTDEQVRPPKRVYGFWTFGKFSQNYCRLMEGAKIELSAYTYIFAVGVVGLKNAE